MLVRPPVRTQSAWVVQRVPRRCLIGTSRRLPLFNSPKSTDGMGSTGAERLLDEQSDAGTGKRVSSPSARARAFRKQQAHAFLVQRLAGVGKAALEVALRGATGDTFEERR